MSVSCHRAFSLLKELAYERYSGSPEEKAAAERLLEVALSTGAEAHIEEFEVTNGRVKKSKLVVTAPYTKEYEVNAFECSDSTPEGGLDGEFYYAENLEDVHLANVKDKIVMINGALRRAAYEKLKKNGAKVILTYTGSLLDRPSDSDCGQPKLRPMLTESLGTAMAMNLRALDAAEIVRRGAKTMHVEIESEVYTATSYNVVATVPGTKYPDEVIDIGGHFDSVHFSHGVYDNLTGTVCVMELLRHFVASPPARTMKFFCFGSEEQGLLGSKAWIAAHEDELAKHRLLINLDMNGTTLGSNVAMVLGTEGFVGYVDGMNREMGIACNVRHDIYSSDCIPFSDKGVPAVNFCRFGGNGVGFIHDRRDNLKVGMLDEKALDIVLQQTLFFAERVVNAAVFPIERKIADKIKSKIDEYLFRVPPKA